MGVRADGHGRVLAIAMQRPKRSVLAAMFVALGFAGSPTSAAAIPAGATAHTCAKKVLRDRDGDSARYRIVLLRPKGDTTRCSSAVRIATRCQRGDFPKGWSFNLNTRPGVEVAFARHSSRVKAFVNIELYRLS